MAQQPKIQNFFKRKRTSAIEEAFLRECNGDKAEAEDWPKEKNILTNKIKVLENEKEELSSKYEKLKTKHVKLLQTLLNLEEKNQCLEENVRKMKAADKNESTMEKSVATGVFKIDMLTDMVRLVKI